MFRRACLTVATLAGGLVALSQPASATPFHIVGLILRYVAQGVFLSGQGQGQQENFVPYQGSQFYMNGSPVALQGQGVPPGSYVEAYCEDQVPGPGMAMPVAPAYTYAAPYPYLPYPVVTFGYPYPYYYGSGNYGGGYYGNRGYYNNSYYNSGYANRGHSSSYNGINNYATYHNAGYNNSGFGVPRASYSHVASSSFRSAPAGSFRSAPSHGGGGFHVGPFHLGGSRGGGHR